MAGNQRATAGCNTGKHVYVFVVALLHVLLLVLPAPAQLLDYEKEGPPDRPFLVLIGAQIYNESNSNIGNAALYVQSGAALSENRDFFAGLTFLTGGLAGVRVVFIGLNLHYYLGSHPDNSFFAVFDFGFAQSTEEFGQLNAPISSGFGTHIAAGFSTDILGFLPPIQVAATAGYYDLEKNYSPLGIQLTFMF